MSFLPMTSSDALDSDAAALSERLAEKHGGALASLDATVLSHLPSAQAYAQLFALEDELVPYIGERAASLFAYAIAEETDSLLFATYFRKGLVDAGENVESPQVTETEQLLIDWGRLIARSPHAISEEMYSQLESAFNPRLRLILLAFASQLIAATLLATAGRVPLDKALASFRKPGDKRQH